jgi:hypothetical protein
MALPGRALITLTASLAMVAAGVGTAVAAQPSSPAASGGKTSNVIVVLRNQHTNLSISRGHGGSARSKAYHADQAPVITKARDAGAKNLHGFDTVNAVAATVTSAQSSELAADPAVAAVYPDLPIKGAPVVTDRPTSSSGGSSGGSSGSQVITGPICPSDPNKPLLEPEALQVTNTAFSDPSTPQAQNIVNGTGVKVAFIADGLDINNPDFIRADSSHVFIDYQDFSGDGLAAPTGGAEAFGDASSIAAQGRQTYDLANFVNPAHPLPPGCTINIRGVAPGASLIGLKVFGNSNTAPTSRFIEAIDYAVTDGADVLNESFGGNPYPDTGDDPISLADASAVAAGVSVVTSTGDAGVTGTIGTPASNPTGVIGVAATTTFQSYMQETFAGAQLSNRTWVDNNISGLSSGGITQSGRTPDLAAPGDLGWALCTPDLNLYEECATDIGNPSPIQNFGGTSQSSPLTAGAAALVIEAYENTHHGVRPSPAVVKQILTSTATDLGHPAYEQGAGLLNTLKAVQAAESWQDTNGSPTATGSALIVNKPQLFSAAFPNSPVVQGLTVTNVGDKPQTVTATTRTLSKTVSDTSGTAAINTATAPFYVDSLGISRSYTTVQFTVAPNVDRLTMTAAARTAPAAGRIILLDPSGAYTAYSIPQGPANFARADVRYPVAGTWTAYLALSKGSGFNGNFVWDVLQQRFTTDGVVFPSWFTLAPGASRHVTVISRELAQPGDVSASVQLTGSVSGATSVPFSLRAVAPPWNNTFTGTITGGNGRSGIFPGAQSNLYYLDVPRGQRSLGVGVVLGDPGNTVLATLTAPNGQSYSWNSNVSSDETALLPAVQDYVDKPMSGRWVLSLQVLNPVSGEVTSSPFQVSVRYNSVSASAPGLPNNARTTLAQGQPVTIPVTITDRSVKPLSYFVDPRLDQVGTLSLAELSGNSTFVLPQPAGVTPFWVVPSHVSSFSLTAAADQPVNVDMSWQGGDPEVYASATGNTTTDTATGSPLSPGIWSANLGQTGPFAAPAPTGTVTVSATATGKLFDTDVTSPGGDFQAAGVNGQSSSAPKLDLAAIEKRLMANHDGGDGWTGPSHPGTGPTPPTSTTIMVTITPSAPKGTTVRGHLYIDAVDNFVANADELIGLPYTYTVG